MAPKPTPIQNAIIEYRVWQMKKNAEQTARTHELCEKINAEMKKPAHWARLTQMPAVNAPKVEG